ncbi:serine/threonine-protein kinase [Cellulomonas sp. A375-1]|uniref:serine/threonine-protein kinase n=1 Tax=Cellulomonas sp. A375-1 TaxID=1672219 RepID=UPI000AF56525|nr:serine/threonine-protein kinase [Cellulomonas sp. A375-1]
MERIGLAPGSQIGGYTIVAPLGSGGMGTVYRAVDDGGTAVALKLLHPQIGADAEGRDRLRREVLALQRLRHKAVAAVLDAEADSTEAFIVTELVAGPNLEEHVRASGPLALTELHELAAGLFDALAAVHAAGVVHRDLKPTNVLVTSDGPVLIDFGIAQAAGDDAAQITSAGLVVGTPGYLAPELLGGAEPSPATDLWGLAAVIAFAATGRPPFGVRPLQAVLARASAGEVDVDGLGPLTADALRRALDPDPDSRLDGDDLIAALAVVAVDGDPLDGPVAAAHTVAYPVDDDLDGDEDALDEGDADGDAAAAVAMGDDDVDEDADQHDDADGESADEDADAAADEEADAAADEEADAGAGDEDDDVDGIATTQVSQDDLEDDGRDEDDHDDDDHDDEHEDDDHDDDDERSLALAATTVIPNPTAKPDPTRVLPAQGVHDGATRVMPAGAGAGATTVLPAGAGADFDERAYDDDLDNPDVEDFDLDPADLQGQRLAPDGFRRPGRYDDEPDAFDGDGDTEWVDETGVEWIEDDLDASEVVPEGSGYERPPAVRRWGSLLAAAAVVATAAALAPVVVLVVLVVLLLLVRTYGTAVEAMHGRREVRGVRASDVPRTLAATPWYLVRAVVGLVPSFVVASCATLLAGGAVAWLVDNGTWTIGDLDAGDEVDGTAAAMVVAALVMLWLVVAWWGPASGMTRTGARRALAVVAPGRLGALVMVAVCLVAAAVIAALVSNGAGIVWAPAPVPTIP